MSAEYLPIPEDGACADLAPQVVDKYFLGNSGQHMFTAKIARAICANCVARPDCLLRALADPPERGIQAGLSANALAAMRTRMLQEHGTVDAKFLTREDLEIDAPPLSFRHPKRPCEAGKRYTFVDY